MIKIKKAIAVELQKIKLEDGDCLFVKFDTEIFDLDKIKAYMEMINELVPKNISVIGYPKDYMEIQVVRKL